MAGARNIFSPYTFWCGGKSVPVALVSLKIMQKKSCIGNHPLEKKNSWWSGVSVSSYFPPNQREHTLNNTSSSIPTQEAKERKRKYYMYGIPERMLVLETLQLWKKSGKYLTSSRNGDQSRNYVTPTAVKTYRKPCGGGRGGLRVRKKSQKKKEEGWLFVGQIAASAPPSLLPVITGSLPIDKSEIEIPFGRKK